MPSPRRSPAPSRPTLPVLVTAVLALLVLLPGRPAAAATADAQVTSADTVVTWDGRTEQLAVRWHLDRPATTLTWLVATPVKPAVWAVPEGQVAALAEASRPASRWLVTHPWLLLDGAGSAAADALAPARQDDPLERPVVRAGTAAGTAEAATREWVVAQEQRGWTVTRLTVRAPSPTTLLGPVGLRFTADALVVPPARLPRAVPTRLLAVAPTVVAQDPDLSSDLPAAQVGSALAADPVFVVANARTLADGVAGLLADRSPSHRWVVTLLTGGTTGASAVLASQDGSVADWRTQVGVIWPAWGPLALAGLIVAIIAGVAALAWGARALTRRRAARRGPPPGTGSTGPSTGPSTGDVFGDLLGTRGR